MPIPTRRAALALLLAPLAALTAQQDATVPAAATLTQQFDAAQNAWNQALRQARGDQNSKAEAELRANRPQAEFVPKFQAGAAAHAGTEQAVPYLTWLVQRAASDAAQAAMVTLMDEHVASPGIRLAVARIGGLKQQFGVERSRAWLDRVLAHNQGAHVLAQARFTRAAMYVGTRAVATGEELRQLAIADLRAAIDQLTEAADGASLRGLAEKLLDEALRLEPGLPAPEIEGEDLDGVTFKLSDYRGKVVMLDFWGDW